MEGKMINNEIELKKYLYSRMKLTEGAKTAQGFDISELNYTDDELFHADQIYIDLVNKVKEINENKKQEEKLMFYVKDGATTDSEVVIENLKGLYEKLRNNEYRVASEKSDEKRKVQYRTILKGFRVIADILKEKDMPIESLVGNLSTIANMNNVCAGGWVEAVTKLTTTYQEDIQKKLGIEKAIVSDELKKRLNLIVEKSIKKITEKVKSDCLEEVYISDRPHYRLFYTKYLNERYGLNLPVIMEFNDSYMEEDGQIYEEAKGIIENYLMNNDLEDMIADDILKTYENILNDSEESSKAREELVDYWVRPYYTRKYEKELETWATSYKKSRNNILREYINKILTENINEDELVKKIEDVANSFMHDCNYNFVSNYIEYYKGKEGRRLVIEDIVRDNNYKEKEYFEIGNDNKNKIKEELKDYLERT